MRLDEEFKKSGYFWLPSNPEKRIPGILVIKDGGSIELEVVGLFDDSIDGINRAINGSDALDRIVGHIEKHGLVTLDDCFYKNRNISFGGISKSTVHVNRAFLGVAYEEKEIMLFNHLKFSVEGIDEWVGRSGIKVEHQFDKKSASITYNPPEEIILNLNNGMKLQITFTWTLPGFPSQKEAKITQKTYFKLSSDQACSLNDFISVAYKITTLLGFAIDKTVCIEKVTATSEAVRQDIGNEKTALVPISIYYPSLPFAKNRPKIDQHRMLFRFGQIQNDAERIVNNWFGAYDQIDPALNLYFSTKAGAHKYLDGKFLALAQGLETYHRRTSKMKLMDEDAFEKLTSDLIEQCPEEDREWLSGRLRHGNEVSLSRRIKSIIEPFKELLGTSKERNKLIRAIVDKRNYLTHYDQSLETAVVKGEELWVLCLKMEAIFQLHLLQILGFTQSEVKSVFENSHELQQKLKKI
ncbi:HEPN domain-containing protein [uncultured Halomonas sp.]|uniref:ApeA N-terminal domain 1-containing protein n=1 Tax=uncultured Halomonas sp. TaxID=173971 RepID=UPI00260177F2|nr:HEPN domain-containing protein [uncultured Halomonas sp.]